MKFGALIVFILALSSPSRAQIGILEKAAVAQFGEPIYTGKHSIKAKEKFVAIGPSLSFHFGPWALRCDFVDGRCVRTAYGRYGDQYREYEWPENEILRILALNAEGQTWTEISPRNTEFHRREWRRSDGATATLGILTGISIAIPEYQRARQTAGAEPTFEGWSGPGPLPPKKDDIRSSELITAPVKSAKE